MATEKTVKKVMEEYDWSTFAKDGFVQPILVTSDHVVIDGAHRTLAARALGRQIPVVVITIPIVMMDPNELTTWLDFEDDPVEG